MYCSKCDNQLSSEDKFCSKCGKKQNNIDAEYSFKEITISAMELGYIFKYKDIDDYSIFENEECLDLFYNQGIEFQPMIIDDDIKLDKMVRKILKEKPHLKKNIAILEM